MSPAVRANIIININVIITIINIIVTITGILNITTTEVLQPQPTSQAGGRPTHRPNRWRRQRPRRESETARRRGAGITITVITMMITSITIFTSSIIIITMTITTITIIVVRRQGAGFVIIVTSIASFVNLELMLNISLYYGYYNYCYYCYYVLPAGRRRGAGFVALPCHG